MAISESEKQGIIARMFELFTPQQLNDLLECADMIRQHGGFGTLNLPLRYGKPEKVEAQLQKGESTITVSKKEIAGSGGKDWTDAYKRREEIPDGKTRKIENE